MTIIKGCQKSKMVDLESEKNGSVNCLKLFITEKIKFKVWGNTVKNNFETIRWLFSSSLTFKLAVHLLLFQLICRRKRDFCDKLKGAQDLIVLETKK